MKLVAIFLIVALCNISATYLPLHVEGLSEGEIIQSYFYFGFSYTEILEFLYFYHGISIGYRQLQRKLKTLGLRRYNPNTVQNNLNRVIAAIESELKSSGSGFGYRTMHLRITQKYHLRTTRECVREILKHLDPEAVEARKKRRLHRRQYSVPGPNFLWHIDGWDKLKPYGLCVHGCIDGYSRRVMWLEASSTNKDPYVICNYFAKCVAEVNGLPCKIRADRGTENVNVELMQTMLRNMNHDTNGAIPFLYGRSTANQRIECWWSKFGIYGMALWISHFKDIEHVGIIDTSNDLHIQCIIFCYLDLLQKELINILKLWNSHYIRMSRKSNQPHGRPDTLYYLPQLCGGVDSIKPVRQLDINVLSEYLTLDPPKCKEPYRELFSIIMEEDGKFLPSNLEDARNLLVYLLDTIDSEI